MVQTGEAPVVTASADVFQQPRIIGRVIGLCGKIFFKRFLAVRLQQNKQPIQQRVGDARRVAIFVIENLVSQDPFLLAGWVPL
jgi:hypothetical protein